MHLKTHHLLGVTLYLVTPVQAAFHININYTHFSGEFTASQMEIFDGAKSTWERIITGYQSGITMDPFDLNIISDTIDGPDKILASAAPINNDTQGGFVYNTSAEIVFDIADIAIFERNGSLDDVILHEMGHVIGIGSTWVENGVYVEDSGQYTGAFGLAAYQREFSQLDAQFVPVELEGGFGTANDHWDEGFGGRATGIVDPLGRDLRFDVMTGWLNTPIFISHTTTQSLRDIGYTVIPEPNMFSFVLGVCGILVVRNCRKTKKSP